MSTEKITAKVNSQKQLTADVFSMWIRAKEIANEARPGQFVSLYCKDGARLLPRPISICEVDQEYGSIRLVYRVVGEGTAEFSKLVAGDSIEVMGPLGNGYTLKDKPALLIAGGIGIPPMLELAKQLTGKKTIVLGYRDVLFLNEDLSQYGDVYIATEDGNCGVNGNVLDAIQAYNLSGEVIYSCGPTPMLRALKAYAAGQQIECQISLEEKMACGIGACLACVCKTKKLDHHTNVHNQRICKDGPVFDAQEVEI